MSGALDRSGTMPSRLEERRRCRGQGIPEVRKLSGHASTDVQKSRTCAGRARQSPRQVILPAPGVKPRDPAGDAVVLALCAAISRIRTHEPEARRGEPEGVHRLRSASRRLRSELKALSDLIAVQSREQLEVELKWLAGLLGEVRDLDILLARLRESASEFESAGTEQPALAPLLEELETRREQKAKAVLDGLDSHRFTRLLATLERFALHPPLEEAASQACRVALPPAAMSSWRRLKKAARHLGRDDPDEEFHEARKRAKSASLCRRADCTNAGPPRSSGRQ